MLCLTKIWAVKWDGLLAIFTVALVIKMVTAFTAAVTQQLCSFNASYIQIQAWNNIIPLNLL